MPKKPDKINGKIYRQQYACLNNTGTEEGKINHGNDGQCTLESPDIKDFGNNVWGCENEIYSREIKSQK